MTVVDLHDAMAEKPCAAYGCSTMVSAGGRGPSAYCAEHRRGRFARSGPKPNADERPMFAAVRALDDAERRAELLRATAEKHLNAYKEARAALPPLIAEVERLIADYRRRYG